MAPQMMPPMTPEQMANAPLAPNPSGQPPNFDHPDSNGAAAVAVMSLFLGLATVAVSLRLWSRIKLSKRAGLDDASAVACVIFIAGMVGLLSYLIDIKALGPHVWDVRLVTFMQPKVSGSLLSVQILGNFANFFAKMAILLFVRRLFPMRASPKTAYAIWIGIIANILTIIILTIYICAMCVPRVGSGGATPAQCPSDLLSRIGSGSAAVNAALDFYVLAVCVPTLWMLQMPMRKKIHVVGVLAMGLAACGLSLATLIKRATNDEMDDPTRKQVLNLVLATLEPSVAIITASLPALPALWGELSAKGSSSLRRLFSKIGSTSSLNSRSNRSEKNRTGEESSMKSLKDRPSDIERGFKNSFYVEERNSRSS